MSLSLYINRQLKVSACINHFPNHTVVNIKRSKVNWPVRHEWEKEFLLSFLFPCSGAGHVGGTLLLRTLAVLPVCERYRGGRRGERLLYTVKPPIEDTPKEDEPLNKGQAESTLVYILYRKSPLKEDNLSTKGRNGWSRKCPY